MILEALHDYLFKEDDLIETRRKASFGHPYLPVAVVVFYVIFCKWIGPALMQNRKPYDLKYTIIVYNFGQMFVNSYIVCQMFRLLSVFWDIRCLRSASPLYDVLMKANFVTILHVYLVKYVDLVDTVFFVLRKKSNQVTFLHLFHHVVMCLLSYMQLFHVEEFRYYIVIGVLINSFIHVIMYLYYALAAFGPGMQKYLWWKKYLTAMQMVQFIIIFVYMVINIANGCDKADTLAVLGLIFLAALLILFFNYYRKSFKTE